MTSKKKLKARIAVLEERLVSANNYHEVLSKEVNASRDAIEAIIKVIVPNFDEGYFDATVREIRATIEWKNARKEKSISRPMPRHHQYPEWINCDRCCTGTPKSEWDYISDMCEKCSKDRSRWCCVGCGDNLDLDNDLRGRNFWLDIVTHCERCLEPPEKAPVELPLHDIEDEETRESLKARLAWKSAHDRNEFHGLSQIVSTSSQ